MLAGPAALVIALCLVPGWVYWRLEGTPRTARTALAEMFEILIASALSLGTASIAYLVIVGRWDTPMADPSLLTAEDVAQNALDVAWSLSVLIAAGCLLAIIGALAQRSYRQRRRHDGVKYHPQEPLWTVALRGRPGAIVTIHAKCGERYTGYLGAFEVTENATPPILLLPPILVERSVGVRSHGRERRVSDVRQHHNLVVPGTEITAIWVANDEE